MQNLHKILATMGDFKKCGTWSQACGGNVSSTSCSPANEGLVLESLQNLQGSADGRTQRAALLGRLVGRPQTRSATRRKPGPYWVCHCHVRAWHSTWLLAHWIRPLLFAGNRSWSQSGCAKMGKLSAPVTDKFRVAGVRMAVSRDEASSFLCSWQERRRAMLMFLCPSNPRRERTSLSPQCGKGPGTEFHWNDLGHGPTPGWITVAGEQKTLIGQAWVWARSGHPAGLAPERKTSAREGKMARTGALCSNIHVYLLTCKNVHSVLLNEKISYSVYKFFDL